MSFSARGQRRKRCFQNFTSPASSDHPKHRRRKPLAPCSHRGIVSSSGGHGDRAVAQLGRAPRSGRGGREFESRRPDQPLWPKSNSRRGSNFSSTARRAAPAMGASQTCRARQRRDNLAGPTSPYGPRVTPGEVRTSVRLPGAQRQRWAQAKLAELARGEIISPARPAPMAQE